MTSAAQEPAGEWQAGEWQATGWRHDRTGDEAEGRPVAVPDPALPSWSAAADSTTPELSANAPPGYTLPARSSRTYPALSEQDLPIGKNGPGNGNVAGRHGEFGSGDETAVHQWSPPAAPAGRQQAGTVYGGPTGHLTVALPTANPVENSGSLTGHILAQGWTDTPTTKSNTTRVVAVLVAGLGLLIAIGLLMVFAAGDVIGVLFDGMLKG